MVFDLKHSTPCVSALKPIIDEPMFGQAFTCKGQKIICADDFDDTKRIKMLKDFTKGCIQVLESDGEQSVALYGNVSGLLAKTFGAVGAVIDGPIRDMALLQRDRFQVFCNDIHPVSALYEWQITNWQVPIKLRGVQGYITVYPNDYIFGDSDGIIVIPSNMVIEVCELAEERAKKEQEVCNQIVQAKTIEKILKMKDEVVVW